MIEHARVHLYVEMEPKTVTLLAALGANGNNVCCPISEINDTDEHTLQRFYRVVYFTSFHFIFCFESMRMRVHVCVTVVAELMLLRTNIKFSFIQIEFAKLNPMMM